MTRPPTLLYVDPIAESRRAIGEAFNRAGVMLRSIADPTQALFGARTLRPDLVLVHAEVRSDTTGKVLDALAQDAAFASLPLALLCSDLGDLRFLEQLRTGVVALLQKPFYAPKHIGEVRALLSSLGSRSGTVSGNGDSPELTNLVEHIRRTQRSGVLTLNARTPEEGRALFARGVLKTAEHQGVRGVEALIGMVATPRAGWSFSEVGATDSEVLIDLPATTGEHPMAAPDDLPIVTGRAITGEVALEVGDVVTGEEEIPIDLPSTPPPQTATAPALSAAANDGSPVRILLVDDDEALCRMFTLLFRKHGFHVDTASDGFAGYEAALAGSYEVVVADLDMPRMDGWGMLRLLRDDFRTRELPVAFLSCHDDYRETLRALESGAQAYFSKATRLDALASQVRALLEPRQSARKALQSDGPVPLSLARLGAQWVVRQIASSGLSGLLEARDHWAQYRVTFRDGRVVHAFAQAGRHAAESEKAFNAYVASRGAEGNFVRGAFPVTPNVASSVEELLGKAALVLNDSEQRLREGLLVQASEIVINPELYALYAQVGPKQWLETARLICEERLPPRDVIARVEASPLDVEETMKDLIRRGVVTLSA